MGSLADAFPEELRPQADGFAARHLRPGVVLRTAVPQTTPPKVKYWVVVATSADALLLGAVFINSEINPHVIRTEALRRLQVPMPQDARELVETSCFADCSQLFPMPLTYAERCLAQDPTCLRGHLHGHELGHLQHLVATSPRIAPGQKRQFGLL